MPRDLVAAAYPFENRVRRYTQQEQPHQHERTSLAQEKRGCHKCQQRQNASTKKKLSPTVTQCRNLMTVLAPQAVQNPANDRNEYNRQNHPDKNGELRQSGHDYNGQCQQQQDQYISDIVTQASIMCWPGPFPAASAS